MTRAYSNDLRKRNAGEESGNNDEETNYGNLRNSYRVKKYVIVVTTRTFFSTCLSGRSLGI
jgi:hypothetical protein